MTRTALEAASHKHITKTKGEGSHGAAHNPGQDLAIRHHPIGGLTNNKARVGVVRWGPQAPTQGGTEWGWKGFCLN